MACNTGCLHRAVIHPLSAKLGGAAMAKRTFIPRNSSGEGRRDMVTRFGIGVCCNVAAIMACCAITSRDWPSGAGMAHRSGRKGRSVLMANIALRGSGYMRCWLAGGCDAMAARTTASHGWRDRIVIKGRARESRRALMAYIAL